MKKLAIIGYGALGKILVSILVDKLQEQYEIVGILDQVLQEKNIEVQGQKITVFPSFEELLNSPAEMVVEIAGVGAVKEYGSAILSEKKDLVITSVGGLADDEILKTLGDKALENNRKVHLTSGAVGGFDILQTITMMGGAQTTIESTKAPKSLNGAPYLKGKDLPEGERTLAFEGNAREAIEGFPKNTNVAVASGLASVGVDEVKVQIVSDPASQGNTHKIIIENPQAKAVVEISSKVDPKNPKSSVTAAWSVAALLANLANPIQLF